MLAEVPAIVVSVALVETSVVIVPEVLVKLVSVADADRVTVADRSEIEAVVAIRLVMVAEAEVSVVTFAEAILRLLMTMLVAVRFVIVALDEVSVVMVPEVLVRLVSVADADLKTVADASETEAVVAIRFVIVAEAEVKTVMLPLAALIFPT